MQIPKRITEQVQFVFPGCEVCGMPSIESTQDHIFIADESGMIVGSEKRGPKHWRCARHSRYTRDLVRTADGHIDRLVPSEADAFHRAIELCEMPIEAILAQSRPHTEEDRAFDREWGSTDLC